MTFVGSEVPPVLLAFDTETTGLDVVRDRIVSAALVGVDERGQEVFRADWLINPGVLIPREATRIHGITTQMAMEEGADPAEAVEQITGLLEKGIRAGCALVVQNAPYDLSMLAFEARRYAVVGLADRVEVAPVLDPMMLAKVANVEGRHSLAALAQRFGVSNPRAHSAYADASTTLKVVRRLLELPELGEAPSVLHEMQQDESRARADAWQKDLRVTDPCARVVSGWPLSKGWTRIGCECRECGGPLGDEDVQQPCRECLDTYPAAAR